MSRLSIPVAAVCMALLAGCAATNPVPSPPNPDAGAATNTAPAAGADAVLQVNGMSCPACAHNITYQLERVPGVSNIRVNLQTGDVTAHLSKTVSAAALRKAVTDAGFTVTGVTAPPAGGNTQITVCSTCACRPVCQCGQGQKCDAGCVCKA